MQTIKHRSKEGSLSSEPFQDRRKFLKFSGAAALSGAILMSGCELLPSLNELPRGVRQKVIKFGKGDTGVLNYAYTLEQLEAAFYIRVVENPSFSNIFTSEEQQILMDLRDHEVVHREFFKAALGGNAIPSLQFNFDSVNFRDRSSVLMTAKTFEDLGVSAYNGAGSLLKDQGLLTIAGKIVSVEARHAAAIRSVLDEDPKSFAGDDIIDENGLDVARPPVEVIIMASPFIVTPLDASEL